MLMGVTAAGVHQQRGTKTDKEGEKSIRAVREKRIPAQPINNNSPSGRDAPSFLFRSVVRVG